MMAVQTDKWVKDVETDLPRKPWPNAYKHL